MAIIREDFGTIEGEIEVGVERLVGTFKWDGVTYNRYVKVVDTGAMPGENTTKDIPHGITGLVGVINISMVAIGTSTLLIPYISITQNTGMVFHEQAVYVDATNIHVYSNKSLSTNYTKSLVTLEYYKAA